jgi:hypothetical protein
MAAGCCLQRACRGTCSCHHRDVGLAGGGGHGYACGIHSESPDAYHNLNPVHKVEQFLWGVAMQRLVATGTGVHDVVGVGKTLGSGW